MSDIDYEQALKLLRSNLKNSWRVLASCPFTVSDAIGVLKENKYSESESYNTIFLLIDLNLIKVLDKNEYTVGLSSNHRLKFVD